MTIYLSLLLTSKNFSSLFVIRFMLHDATCCSSSVFGKESFLSKHKVDFCEVFSSFWRSIQLDLRTAMNDELIYLAFRTDLHCPYLSDYYLWYFVCKGSIWSKWSYCSGRVVWAICKHLRTIPSLTVENFLRSRP